MIGFLLHETEIPRNLTVGYDSMVMESYYLLARQTIDASFSSLILHLRKLRPISRVMCLWLKKVINGKMESRNTDEW